MNVPAANTSQVRIIAGRWRGRKIQFPNNLSIRPTPDRVRETLFNWLSPYLVANRHVRALDLFAGSGVLGFEALSRGATNIIFVDSEKSIIKNLIAQHQIFKIDTDIGKNCAEYKHRDAHVFLKAENNKFDLVFVDPPYRQNLIATTIQLLVEHDVMNKDGLIYIEMAKDESAPGIPEDWTLIKSKVMSQVASYLYQIVK